MNEFDDLNIGLIYGTDTGTTQEVGEKIAHRITEQGYAIDMINVAEASKEVLEMFDMLIMGIPTWNYGSTVDEWRDFESELTSADLSSKIVALYGLGNQRGYADFFVDALGWLHNLVLETGAEVIGAWPAGGYQFEASRALNPGGTEFCGLAIDEDQQYQLTDMRVAAWVDQIMVEASDLMLELEVV